MSACNRYGAKGRFVESIDGDGIQAIVLWDAEPDGRHPEYWVELRQAGLLPKAMRGPGYTSWTLAEARDAAHAAIAEYDAQCEVQSDFGLQ